MAHHRSAMKAHQYDIDWHLHTCCDLLCIEHLWGAIECLSLHGTSSAWYFFGVPLSCRGSPLSGTFIACYLLQCSRLLMLHFIRVSSYSRSAIVSKCSIISKYAITSYPSVPSHLIMSSYPSVPSHASVSFYLCVSSQRSVALYPNVSWECSKYSSHI